MNKMHLCYILIVTVCFLNLTPSLDCASIAVDKKSEKNTGPNGDDDAEYAASVVELHDAEQIPPDDTSVHKKHLERKKGSKASKFGEKKGHKKGHHTRGYNNRFHKDEYHKEHKLYDDPTKRSNRK